MPNHLSLACAQCWICDSMAPRCRSAAPDFEDYCTVCGVTVSSKLPEPSHLWTNSHHSGFPRQMKGSHCRRPRPSPHGPHRWIGAPHHVRSPRTCPDPIPAFCEILHPLTYAAHAPTGRGGRQAAVQSERSHRHRRSGKRARLARTILPSIDTLKPICRRARSTSR